MTDHKIATLRERIAIERPTQAEPDEATGEPVVVWVPFTQHRIPAAFTQTQSERESGRKNTAVAAGKFRIRWRADVDTTCRILHENRVFEITGTANPDGRRRWLEIDATETK